MEDLKIAGYGKANGGSYNKISINGYGEILESVNCNTFKGTGSAKIKGSIETNDLKFTGDIDIEGFCNVNNLDLTGRLKIKNDAKLKKIDSSGDISVLGNLNTEDLLVNGHSNHDKFAEQTTI